MLDLFEESRRLFSDALRQDPEALVYFDSSFGEAAHFGLGLPFLLESGAQAVCSLENACPEDAVAASRLGATAQVESVVIFTGRLLFDAHRHILRAVRSHRSLRKCSIQCAVSEDAHSEYPDGLLRGDVYDQYEALLREDLASDLEATPSQRATATPAEAEKAGTPSNGWDVAWEEEEGSPSAATSAANPVDGWNEDVVFDETPEPGFDRQGWGHEDEWDSWGKAHSPQAKNEQPEEIEISIQHFPLLLCALSSTGFILPATSAVAEAPLSVPEGPGGFLSRGLPAVDLTGMGLEAGSVPPGVSLLAHWLMGALGSLELKAEVFSVGSTAKAVARSMVGLPQVESRRTAAVILIDRTLDLVTPASHSDSLLDRILSALPNRPPQPPPSRPNQSTASTPRCPLDSRIPIADLFPLHAPMANHPGGSHMMGGALFHPRERGAVEELGCKRSAKEGVLSLRRALQEALRGEKLGVPKLRLGVVGAAELKTLAAPLVSQPRLAFKHRILLQLAAATAVAVEGPTAVHWEAVASAEKVMVMSARDPSQSLASQLKDLVAQCRRREGDSLSSPTLSLQNVLTIALMAYALEGDKSDDISNDGPFSWKEEYEIKEAVVNAILSGKQSIPHGVLHGLEEALESFWQRKRGTEGEGWEELQEEEVNQEGVDAYSEAQLRLEVKDRVEEVFGRLHIVAAARRQLRGLRLLDEGAPGTHVPLLRQLLTRVFQKEDIPDMEHSTSSVKHFLKSGLGRFGLQSKPRPTDHHVILVFIIGGIALSEVKEARDVVGAHPAAEGRDVLLGGTTCLLPRDIYSQVISDS